MNMFVVLFLITPIVDAFTPAAAAATAITMKLQHHTYNFNFPNIPRQRGLFYLHSPGILTVEPNAGIPFFNIINATAPFVTTATNLTSVTFQCRTLGFSDVKTIKMFTAQRHVCNMVMYRCGRPYFLAQLRVLPLFERNPYSDCALENTRGHRLQVKATTLSGGGWLLDLLLPFSVASKVWEESLLLTSAAIREDPRLAAYRRMVLGLPEDC